ncbi:hypothetical protein K1719_020873 [Acacia pycnantha]|nr:hypothetical protein K1719_020873 [Acacia pycnantha]
MLTTFQIRKHALEVWCLPTGGAGPDPISVTSPGVDAEQFVGKIERGLGWIACLVAVCIVQKMEGGPNAHMRIVRRIQHLLKQDPGALSISHNERATKRKEREKKDKEFSKKKSKSGVDETSGGGDKLPYVHVRARRGQATDSHSLAERAKREKINARMKLLQELVPGCNKCNQDV